MDEETFIEFLIPEGKGKERLDIFLTRYIGSVSRARLQRLIEEGLIKVDGQRAKASHLVRPSERIEVFVPKPRKIDILPENIPLEILFEDEHLLVVNKKAGMVVHPAFSNWTGTLVNALLHHCGDLSSIGGRQRPGIVHRLDKGTSGIMVVAKNDLSHQHLSRQFAEKTVERLYRALSWGRFRKRAGRVETCIARSPKDRKRMAVQPSGKIAITNYQVLDTFRMYSLVQLVLETGRTHQIRVHLSYLGHPVFGDLEYGGRNRRLGALSTVERRFAAELLDGMDRQALHAKVLGFVHPVCNRKLRFESDLPSDMQLLLRRVRNQP